MSVYGITWADINGNSNFVFDANINSVRTWITVSTDTTESVARKFQVTMYRGVAGGGQVEVTTLTAKYVRTENNVRLYQAEYIFNVADWIQFRPNDNNYVTVWVNTPESLYTSATVKFMYMPTINSIRITSNLPDSSIFVQNVTPFNIEVEAVGYDGATIQAVTADIQSTANPLTEVDGVWSGTRNAYTSYRTVEFWVRATDQYQVTKLQTVKLSVKKHDVPAITTDIYRCDLDGTKNENGAYLSVTAYASSVPTALGIYSLYLEGTIIGASSSIIAQYINSGQTYILGNGGITSNDSYNLTFTATDKAAIYGGTALSVSVIVGVPKVVRVINVKAGGKGVAFGKVAETDELVDLAWNIRSAGQIWSERATGDGRYAAIVAKSQTNAAIAAYNDTNANYIELVDGSSGNRGLYTDSGWMLYLGTDGKIHFGKPVDATNLPVASATEAGIVNTGAQTFAGAKTFNDRMTIGTASSATTEALDVTSNSGRIQLYSTGNANGDSNRGLWVAAHGTGSSRFIIVVDTNNNVSFNSGTWKADTIAIAKGGTGATNAATARSNLGLGSSANLLSGTLTNTETTLKDAHQYSALVIYGKPTGGSLASMTIPMSAIGTSFEQWQLADNSGYRTFQVKYSGNDVIIKGVAATSKASITDVRGII